MAHSNQIREFRLGEQGVDLVEVYLGPEGVLTGSARLAQEARERSADVARQAEADRIERAMEHRAKAVEAQIAAIRAQFQAEREEMLKSMDEQRKQETRLIKERQAMAVSRKAETAENGATVKRNRRARA